MSEQHDALSIGLKRHIDGLPDEVTRACEALEAVLTLGPLLGLDYDELVQREGKSPEELLCATWGLLRRLAPLLRRLTDIIGTNTNNVFQAHAELMALERVRSHKVYGQEHVDAFDTYGSPEELDLSTHTSEQLYMIAILNHHHDKFCQREVRDIIRHIIDAEMDTARDDLEAYRAAEDEENCEPE